MALLNTVINLKMKKWCFHIPCIRNIQNVTKLETSLKYRRRNRELIRDDRVQIGKATR